MVAPGWYSDHHDPSIQRYHDGQNWTEHQRPAQAPQAPQPPQPPQQAAPPRFQPPPAQFPPPQVPPAQFPPPQVPSAYAAPAPFPPQAPGGPPPPQWQPGSGTIPQPYAAAGWQAAPSAGYQPPYVPAAGGRRNRPLILALVVVVVAGLLTGSYFLFLRGDNAPTLTYHGAKIEDAAGVLKKAETNLTSIVSARHGAKDSDARCYFGVPDQQQSGAKKTDVDSNLRCGPVLFVDGDPAKEYLSFALTSAGSGSPADLTAASTPQNPEPDAAPADTRLQRPDGKKPPSGAGGLAVPKPPPAVADTITATDPGDTSLPTAPAGAVIGSLSGGITVSKLGPVARYGHGDDARSAPPGQKLIEFQTAAATGDDGTSADLISAAAVSVDGGTGRPIPTAGAGQDIVVAVPSAATTVDLVLDDNNFKQSISLLTGKPAAGNVVVLARTHRSIVTPKTARVTLTYSPAVVFADGKTGASEPAKVTFNFADLNYRNVDGKSPLTASSPAKAIMHVSMTYVGSHATGSFGFPSTLLTFTPTGGSPVHARNISGTAGKIYNVFEVPGNVTTGTLTISGSVAQAYRSGSGHYRLGIRKAVRVKISFAAG